MDQSQINAMFFAIIRSMNVPTGQIAEVDLPIEQEDDEYASQYGNRPGSDPHPSTPTAAV